jgi:hypothetical protein
MKTILRNNAMLAGILLAASPLFAANNKVGSNTYTIQNGGRLTIAYPTNVTVGPCLVTGYHTNSKTDSIGFNISDGAVDINNGKGEIGSGGSSTFCAPNGDLLELRSLMLENFGDQAFVTAEVSFTPAGGANAGVKQHDGRMPIFEVVKSDFEPTATSSTTYNVVDTFSIWMDPAFQMSYIEFFMTPVRAKDAFGTLVYQYGIVQEQMPVAASN